MQLGPAQTNGDGAVYAGVEQQLDVVAPKLDLDVIIDGNLDDDAWREAAVLSGFSQYKPVDGVPAEDATEVLVWYSTTAIHFGIRAHEPHGSVNATLADRDNIQNDDHVQILLDTFNDGRRSLAFAVNPLGIQADGARSESGARATTSSRRGPSDPVDLAPDFRYESRGRLTEYGYEVEVRIPFKTLSFQPAETQDWGINVIRRVQHSGREQTWTPALQGRASFLAQGGRLRDMNGMDRGLVLDINPVVTSSVNGNPTDGAWDYDTTRPEFSGNVRWGLTSNMTMSGTVNPDFSQVEADAAQGQFDPRSAVFFDEKRPFFLEGSENFQTGNRLIYTRRISNPLTAAKIGGKISGTEIGFLSAVDDETLSSSGEDHPIFNILRVKRDLGDESTLGMAYTDRVEGSNYNRVASVDSRIVFSDIYAFQAQGAMTFDRTDGPTVDGHLWDLNLRRSGRMFGMDLLFKGLDDELVARSGFLSRVGTVQARAQPTLTFYGDPGARVEQYRARLNIDFTWTHEGFMSGASPNDAWKFHISNDFVFRGGWQLGTSIFIEEFYFPPDLYTDYAIQRQTPTGPEIVPFVGTPGIMNYDISLRLTTPSSPTFTGFTSVILGRDENFDEWAAAYIMFVTLQGTWRPSDQIRVEGRLVRQQRWRTDDWSVVRIVDIPRIKLEYQLTRSIFFRFVGQYDALNVDALHDDSRTEDPIVIRNSEGVYEPSVAVNQNVFSVDGLFSFEPSPGTVIFAGYGSTMNDDDTYRFRNLERTQDGFFVKLSYLLRM